MAPSPPDRSPDDSPGEPEESGDWQQRRAAIGSAWSALAVGKAAVPVLLGCLLVSVPYVFVVVRVTNAIVAWVDALGATAVLALVIFFTLTTFSSFLFSAVMLVDRLLPWESPISL